MKGTLMWDGIECRITHVALRDGKIYFTATGHVPTKHKTPRVTLWSIIGVDGVPVDSGSAITDHRKLHGGFTVEFPLTLSFVGLTTD